MPARCNIISAPRAGCCGPCWSASCRRWSPAAARCWPPPQAGAPDDIRAVAAIFVRPFAELATGNARERSLILLLSDLHNDVSLSLDQIMDLVGDTAIGAMPEPLCAPGSHMFRRRILAERLIVANSVFLNAAALRARGGARERRLNDKAFQENLVDMFHGAIATKSGLAS